MSLLQILPALILWTVVIIRIVGLRFGWKPGILTAMLPVSIGTTLNIDPMYLAVDALLGGRNILNLVVHIVLGLGMTELSRLIVGATGASNARWLLLVLAGLALSILQTVLLLASETPGSATNFTDVFAGIPTIGWYQSLFFAWIGLITGYTGIECLRRDRTGETVSFRVGFDITAVSCLIGVLAVGVKLLLVAQEATGIDSYVSNTVYVGYRALVALTLVGFAVGFALPAYQRIRLQSAEHTRIRSALRRLRPIVSRLVETDAGQRAREGAALSLRPRACRNQLYRWVIFIDDIRVQSPELLSAEEIELVDNIEARIARSGPVSAKVQTGS
ncbi:hypothetical protein [Arthrobacter mangrovi]|uniref:Uncharacterized protein n=1 Tax=Arthrobacter mangrovi TaxID=2966350 RepID=A0ABQ5MYL9_9MICC|nr:hypothetical protein [Arthrobacter mangrovi]GLB69095.1 hypothetical protein AHIS1636_35380 [Arthrobacter mangrovi]